MNWQDLPILETQTPPVPGQLYRVQGLQDEQGICAFAAPLQSGDNKGARLGVLHLKTGLSTAQFAVSHRKLPFLEADYYVSVHGLQLPLLSASVLTALSSLHQACPRIHLPAGYAPRVSTDPRSLTATLDTP